MIARLHYLGILAVCLVLSAPLECVLGARVYRQPRRLLSTLAAVVAPFYLWDLVAVARHHWMFSPHETTGWTVPGGVPIEELAFFVVVPLCALLTYGVVRSRAADRVGEARRG